jgi:S1-C subfamily serine protease
VAANSPAAAAGLAVGDRIYEVNGQPFINENDFRDTVLGLLDSGSPDFTLLVETRGHVRTIHIRSQSHALAAKAGS